MNNSLAGKKITKLSSSAHQVASTFCLAVLVLVVLCDSSIARQTSQQLDPAFARITEGGKHLTVITDLPLDDEIKALPAIFDLAMSLWCEQFKVDPRKTDGWRPTLYLMLDRNRFRQAGLIPKSVPEFKHGWQLEDEMWVQEQSSAYYRRHLVLHEGTHWFMFRKYGFYDTPWLAEGLAEHMGTHRWVDTKLQMGIIPANREEVPYWGRIKLIREQCADELAPSLEDILSYSNTAHQDAYAYAWSWALTLFLMHHPDTSKVFEALLKQPAMNSREVERWLRAKLTGKLPRVRAAWRSFVSELDYGYTTEPGMLQLTADAVPFANEHELEIRSDRSWQSSGVTGKAGQKIRIRAAGEYVIANNPKPWVCQPAGVTLEYYRGHPLGKLMLVQLQPQKEEEATALVDPIGVGEDFVFEPTQDGEIFFRINESAGNLGDNSGTLKVKLSSP